MRIKTLAQHSLIQAAVVLVVAFLIFRFGIRPAAPRSVLILYMGVVLVAMVLYVSSSQQAWQQFQAPIYALLVGQKTWVRGLRWAVVVLIPALVGVQMFIGISRDAVPPAELRQVHPAPPSSLQFRGETIQIQGLNNPFWEDPKQPPNAVLVSEGRDVYVTRCVFCHGDALQGDGLFAAGLNPKPADFTDPATITQLQQSYVFWRISKGGKGLPSESAPWNSAMPAWEDDLTADEIWKVIMYIYEAAGPNVNPRVWD
ncbi:MAG: cytochrome c [SAR202 cluster bacterium]|nr:cytochrome c [SAR202 cluster bacterium]